MSVKQQNYIIGVPLPNAAVFKSRPSPPRTADEKNTFQDRRQKAGFLSGESNKSPDVYNAKKFIMAKIVEKY